MNYRFYLTLLLILAAGALAVSCATQAAQPPEPTALAPLATVAGPVATEQPPTATTVPATATLPPPSATSKPTLTSLPPTPVPTTTSTLLPETPTALPTVPKEPGGEHDWEVTAEPWTVVPLTATAIASPGAGDGASSGGSLDAVIPPGEGRELLFNNCTACHSVVCSLIGQRTAGNWGTVRAGHSDRVPGLSEADQDILYAYLIENFGDQKPEPDLPPELREQGCSAQ
jgi:hypothetical protein